MEKIETNNGALGNRIGVFQVSTISYSNQSSYIRSKLCILSTSRTNDNETVTVVTPVAGPFSDGTMVWRIAANYRPDDTRANCYFNGSPGIFDAVGFQNSDNVATTTYRNNSCNGYYCSDRTVTTQLSFTTGEVNLIGDSFSPPENRQCEVAPQSCTPAEKPVDSGTGGGG